MDIRQETHKAGVKGASGQSLSTTADSPLPSSEINRVYLKNVQLKKDSISPSNVSNGFHNPAFLNDDDTQGGRKLCRTPGDSSLHASIKACPTPTYGAFSLLDENKKQSDIMVQGLGCMHLAQSLDNKPCPCTLGARDNYLRPSEQVVERKHSDSILNSASPDNKDSLRINIARTAVDLHDLQKSHGIPPTSQSFHKKILKKAKYQCACNLYCILSVIKSLFPIVDWLPKYNLKEHLMLDITAGFTIAILHIPQGMAYGLLASAGAINGLYVSFFPVIVYFLMGTSRHVSIGTFAVISLMLRSATQKLVPESDVISDLNNTDSLQQNNTIENNSDNDTKPLTNLEVLTAMAIAVGIWQIFMGIFRLGGLTVLLSDHLISGFSTGAACHVATSQLKDLFGIKLHSFNGPVKLVYTYIDIFRNLQFSNLATVIISATAIFALALVKEQINSRFRTKLKLPIPIDLFVVIVATVASFYGDFTTKYEVKIMGDIPTGLPAPVPPRLDLFPEIISDSFAVALVGYAISLSMAKIFSKKNRYPINPNQELIALGSANVISSFFACYPCSASLSRSLVQERAGGKTQIAGIVSCGFLLIVLLVLAPLFYTLPKCILSAVILVALKGMFLQVTDLKKAWCISRIDALVWVVTFLLVVLLDVEYGLLGGLIFSILTIVFRATRPAMTFLGKLPDTELYLDTKRFTKATELRGVKIFHFEAALCFANGEYFKHILLKHVHKDERDKSNDKSQNTQPIHHVIIDCSSFSYIDMAGVDTLLEVHRELKEAGISMYLAGCSVPMYEILVKSEYLQKVPSPSIFPSIHDAVHHCQ